LRTRFPIARAGSDFSGLSAHIGRRLWQCGNISVVAYAARPFCMAVRREMQG
jgi:hypothetical protein